MMLSSRGWSSKAIETCPGTAARTRLMSVMDRMGTPRFQTTQKYLHTLPDTDQRNLDALTRISNESVERVPPLLLN